MACGLEVRVPFCDHELVDYVFNVPWALKQMHGREKGLLRAALENVLPGEIVWRKKSPYPKTHNPKYSTIVRQAVAEMLDDSNSPIRDWIDIKKIYSLLNRSTADNGHIPWFGQLMGEPQFLAYLLQVNTWLRDYRIRIV
jgi:asparagine synthase (glutamine-hydrolysing)